MARQREDGLTGGRVRGSSTKREIEKRLQERDDLRDKRLQKKLDEKQQRIDEKASDKELRIKSRETLRLQKDREETERLSQIEADREKEEIAKQIRENIANILPIPEFPVFNHERTISDQEFAELKEEAEQSIARIEGELADMEIASEDFDTPARSDDYTENVFGEGVTSLGTEVSIIDWAQADAFTIYEITDNDFKIQGEPVDATVLNKDFLLFINRANVPFNSGGESFDTSITILDDTWVYLEIDLLVPDYRLLTTNTQLDLIADDDKEIIPLWFVPWNAVDGVIDSSNIYNMRTGFNISRRDPDIFSINIWNNPGGGEELQMRNFDSPDQFYNATDVIVTEENDLNERGIDWKTIDSIPVRDNTADETNGTNDRQLKYFESPGLLAALDMFPDTDWNLSGFPLDLVPKVDVSKSLEQFTAFTKLSGQARRWLQIRGFNAPGTFALNPSEIETHVIMRFEDTVTENAEVVYAPRLLFGNWLLDNISLNLGGSVGDERAQIFNWNDALATLLDILEDDLIVHQVQDASHDVGDIGKLKYTKVTTLAGKVADIIGDGGLINHVQLGDMPSVVVGDHDGHHLKTGSAWDDAGGGAGLQSLGFKNAVGTSASDRIVIDLLNNEFYDTSSVVAADFTNRFLEDSVGNIVLDWDNALTQDGSAVISMLWATRELVDNVGITVLDWGSGRTIGAGKAWELLNISATGSVDVAAGGTYTHSGQTGISTTFKVLNPGGGGTQLVTVTGGIITSKV